MTGVQTCALPIYKELAREIVEKLNTRESIMRTDAKAFAIRCNEQNISISSVDMEQEKLDYMEKRGDLRVPYCSVPLENNNCRLYFETANADKVMSELKYATLILSASARANIMVTTAPVLPPIAPPIAINIPVNAAINMTFRHFPC